MCDTIAALRSTTAKGTVLFGKNSDRDYREPQYLEMLPAARHGRGAHVHLTYKAIDQVPETSAVLLSGMDYVRLALERARDVDEAINVITELLRAHGQGGNAVFGREMAYHNSFLLADPHRAKALETVDRDWVVKRVNDYCAISNAMSIETEFDARSQTLGGTARAAGLHDEGRISFRGVFEDASRSIGGHHRRNRAMTLLGERRGEISATDVFRILRDHVEGPSVEGRPGSRICAHRRTNPIGQTTASLVADLAPMKKVYWSPVPRPPARACSSRSCLKLACPTMGRRLKRPRTRVLFGGVTNNCAGD